MTDQPTSERAGFKVRRVVTGHDGHGRSCIVSDTDCGTSLSLWHQDFLVIDAWRVAALPANNGDAEDPCVRVELEPTRTGNVVRIVRLPPDSAYIDQIDIRSGFNDLGAAHARTDAGDSSMRHPLMHRSHTLDYVVVLVGEIHVIMDEGEAVLRPGDILIQRGTNHAWSNRGTEPCVMAVMLSGAQPLKPDV